MSAVATKSAANGLRRFKPHPAYRDSGVEWLGRIPAQWEVAPLFTVARELDVRNTRGEETNVLSLSYGRIVRRDVSDNFGLIPESFDTYQIVTADNIVLRLTDLQNDKKSLRVGLVEERGIITSAYVALHVRARIAPKYAFYLLYAYDLTKVFYALGGGVRQTMKFEDLKWMPILVPNEAEQHLVTAFLDWETVRIDELIVKKERLIELLKEERAAIVTRAVTKGLDSKVAMKHSGFEWLGEIPAHWSVIPLKRLLRRCDYGISESLADGGDIPVVTMTHIQEGEVLTPEEGSVTEVDEDLFLDCWDLLFNRTNSRELVGKVGLFRGSRRDRVTFASYLVRMTACDGANPEWLNYLLNSSGVLGLARSMALLSINQANLNPTRYTQILVPFPSEEEQVTIAGRVRREVLRVDALVTRVHMAIARLKELRTALISAAVMGKIDVREKVA